MERRLQPGAVEMRQEAHEPATITGTAAVIYRKGEAGTEYNLAAYGLDATERLMPGCFDEALAGADIYAAVNHDPSLVFARTTADTLTVWSDADGLHYRAAPVDTTAGRDAIANAKSGNFAGSSFAFSVAKDGETWRKEDGRQIREVTKVERLVDVSPVTSPAYKATTVNARYGAELRASHAAWRAEEEAAELKAKAAEVEKENEDRDRRARLAELTAGLE